MNSAPKALAFGSAFRPIPSRPGAVRRPRQAPSRAPAALLALALLTACAESGEPEAYVHGDVEVRPIEESFETVAGWLAGRMRPDFEALQPGIGRDHVDAAVAGLGLDLPEEVYRLYAWHNGQRGGADGEDAQLFPGYRFLPIEEAVSQAELMRDVLWKMPLFGRWHWPRSYLPVFELYEDYFVVVCRGGDGAVVLDWTNEGGPAVAQASLAATLQEIADGYTGGAYTVTDEGHLESVEEKEVEIFRRYHPALPSRRALLSDGIAGRDSVVAADGSRVETVSLLGGGAMTRTYDPRGNLVAEDWGPRGLRILTAYDDLGRPFRRDGGAFEFDRVVTWTWDHDVATIRIEHFPRPGVRVGNPPAADVLRARRGAGGEWSVLRRASEL